MDFADMEVCNKDPTPSELIYTCTTFNAWSEHIILAYKSHLIDLIDVILDCNKEFHFQGHWYFGHIEL